MAPHKTRNLRVNIGSVIEATKPLNTILQYLNEKERINVCYLNKAFYRATLSNVLNRVPVAELNLSG